jgi:hypothetical protein
VSTIEDFAERVRRIEAGVPPGPLTPAEAVAALEADIVGTEWATAEKRYAAQALIVRLSRARQSLDQAARGPARATA